MSKHISNPNLKKIFEIFFKKLVSYGLLEKTVADDLLYVSMDYLEQNSDNCPKLESIFATNVETVINEIFSEDDEF